MSVCLSVCLSVAVHATSQSVTCFTARAARDKTRRLRTWSLQSRNNSLLGSAASRLDQRSDTTVLQCMFITAKNWMFSHFISPMSSLRCNCAEFESRQSAICYSCQLSGLHNVVQCRYVTHWHSSNVVIVSLVQTSDTSALTSVESVQRWPCCTMKVKTRK